MSFIPGKEEINHGSPPPSSTALKFLPGIFQAGSQKFLFTVEKNKPKAPRHQGILPGLGCWATQPRKALRGGASLPPASLAPPAAQTLPSPAAPSPGTSESTSGAAPQPVPPSVPAPATEAGGDGSRGQGGDGCGSDGVTAEALSTPENPFFFIFFFLTDALRSLQASPARSPRHIAVTCH